MRHQERKYIQSNVECLRNKTTMSVNCSSDIDTFEFPTWGFSGTGYENTCVVEEMSLSDINYQNILNIAVSACTNATTCLSSVTWSLVVKEDAEVVYDGSTGTTSIFWTGGTTTGDTPTEGFIRSALENAFNSLGYNFYNNGMLYYIRKPYGTTLLEVNACLEIKLEDSGGICSGGVCSATCVNMGTTIYPSLTVSSDSVYIIDDEVGVNSLDAILVFNNPHVFDAPRNGKFRYEIFKYNNSSSTFAKPIVYTDGWFTRTEVPVNNKTETIPTLNLKLDGDYIVKGYWEVDVTTEYRSELGDKFTTSNHTSGAEAVRYNRNYDQYFIANYIASTPVFSLNNVGFPKIGGLRVLSFIANGTTDTFQLEGDLGAGENGTDPIINLNGVTMAWQLDYTLNVKTVSGNTSTSLTFLDPIVSGDVITYSYVSNGTPNRFRSDLINVTTIINSGTTGGQGSSNPYYNTTEGKYEIYITLIPVNPRELYVTINGVTLANNIDYYQSITDPKRIILEGEIMVGDIINIFYMSYAEVSDNIWFNPQRILWTITRAPQEVNGVFTVEVAEDRAFTAITQSATTDYVVNKIDYEVDIAFSGTVGDTYYYRIKNEKNYESMCGDIISTQAYSEVVPIIVRENSINSY